TGTYLMSGGGVNTVSLVVADDSNTNGTFTQQAGSIVATGSIALADFSPSSHGTFTMLGGTTSSSQIFVGAIGAGTFTQSGGSNSTGTISLATNPSSTGLYTLSGGSLTITNSLNLNAASQFVQTGGALTVGSFNVAGPIAAPYSFTAGLLRLDDYPL